MKINGYEHSFENKDEKLKLGDLIVVDTGVSKHLVKVSTVETYANFTLQISIGKKVKIISPKLSVSSEMRKIVSLISSRTVGTKMRLLL